MKQKEIKQEKREPTLGELQYRAEELQMMKQILKIELEQKAINKMIATLSKQKTEAKKTI